jgi:hypothetical protein
MQNVTVTYAVGDIVNGTYATFDNVTEATQLYEDDAWEGARAAQENQCHFDDDDERHFWDFEDFLSASSDAHYIEKVTTTITVDEDGNEEVTEDREII